MFPSERIPHSSARSRRAGFIISATFLALALVAAIPTDNISVVPNVKPVSPDVYFVDVELGPALNLLGSLAASDEEVVRFGSEDEPNDPADIGFLGEANGDPVPSDRVVSGSGVVSSAVAAVAAKVGSPISTVVRVVTVDQRSEFSNLIGQGDVITAVVAAGERTSLVKATDLLTAVSGLPKGETVTLIVEGRGPVSAPLAADGVVGLVLEDYGVPPGSLGLQPSDIATSSTRPGAGLATAIHLFTVVGDLDLDGRRVVALGDVSPTGEIVAPNRPDLRLRGALASDADVIVVPAEMSSDDDRVFGVETLSDALALLSQRSR